MIDNIIYFLIGLASLIGIVGFVWIVGPLLGREFSWGRLAPFGERDIRDMEDWAERLLESLLNVVASMFLLGITFVAPYFVGQGIVKLLK